MHRYIDYSPLICSLFRSVFVFMLFLFLVPGKPYRHPVSNPYAAFIPHKKVYITNSYTHIIKHTDIAPIINNIMNLTVSHINIVNQAHQANLTEQEITTFSSHTYEAIEDLAKHLKDGIDTLYHPPDCHIHPRAKRDTDVIQPTGIFPQVGRLLSWLTGALTTDAAAVINRNSKNLHMLRQAQTEAIKVINHTAIYTHRNTLHIQALEHKLQTLSQHLSLQIEATENKVIIANMFSDLKLSVEQLHRSIEGLTTEWHWALNGKLGPQAFRHGLFNTIQKTLDPTTANIHNIRYIIKRSAELTIEACTSHIYTKIKIPLLKHTPLPTYKVHTNPVWHIDHYERISTNTATLAWTQQQTYEFTHTERAQCIELKSSLICKSPRVKLPLKHSCIFNIFHNTLHTTEVCNVTKMATPGVTIIQDNNFIIYAIPHNQSQLLNHKCSGEPLTVKEITGSGIVHIKEHCKIAIGNTTFSSNMKPFIFNSQPVIINHITNMSIKHHTFTDNNLNESTPIDTIIEDMDSLNVASELLGQFEINPDIIIIASGVSSILLVTAFILIIILYIQVGCPQCPGCNRNTNSLHRYPIYRGSTR